MSDDAVSEKTCSGFYVGYDLEGGSRYHERCWRRCGCELPGCPALDPNAAPPPIVHVRSQDGQPYGSERRCCNHCGVMLWGPESPPYVDNWTDWRDRPDRCSLSESERTAALAALIETPPCESGHVVPMLWCERCRVRGRFARKP